MFPLDTDHLVFFGALTGRASINDEALYIHPTPTPTARFAMTGNGPPVNDPNWTLSVAILQFDYLACTYDWSVSVYINAVDEAGHPSIQPSVDRVGDHNLSLANIGPDMVLSGTGDYPAVLNSQLDTTWPRFYPNGFADEYLLPWQTPPEMGTAPVTWRFSPVLPTPTAGPVP